MPASSSEKPSREARAPAEEPAPQAEPQEVPAADGDGASDEIDGANDDLAAQVETITRERDQARAERAGGGDADDQAGRGNDTVIGAQNRRPKPADPVDRMAFRVRGGRAHVSGGFRGGAGHRLQIPGRGLAGRLPVID